MWITLLMSAFLVVGGCHGEYTVEQDELLREDLMNGYSRKSRPEAYVAVDVDFYLLSINDLDTKASTFSTSAYFDLWWTDNRLTWDKENYGGIHEVFFDEKTIWRPTISIVNEAYALDIIYNENGPIVCAFDGACLWDPPRVTETSCELDVTFYPCDVQTCSINLITWLYKIYEVDLYPTENGTHLTYFSENVEWHILSHTLTRERTEKRGQEYSQIKAVFTIQRRPTHQIISIVIPTVVMAFMSPFVFLLPADSGERSGFIMTMFLAYVVLLTLVQDQLPSAAKSPSILSIYLTIITILAATCVMVTVVISRLHNGGEEEPPKGAINKIVIYMEKVMCRNASTKKNTAVITPIVDGPDQDAENQAKDTTVRQHTWKQIAAIMDMFCFRFIMFVTFLWTVALVVLLLVGWFIHPKLVD